MGRTIKLILYYFAYQLAMMGVLLVGYMLFHHSTELPDTGSRVGLNLTLWAQLLATTGIGVHLLAGKYVPRNEETWAYGSLGKIGLTLVFLVTGMGLWTNYLNEWLALPNHLQELINKMMNHPLGILSITILAPMVEEILFRGAIQGHLLRKWQNPTQAILTSSLIFGLVHGNPAQIPFAFILGIALGWVYYRTGSLLPGILMHFINNTAAVSLYWISGHTESTMNDFFGTGGAASMAMLGVILTGISIKRIQKQIPRPVLWKKEKTNSSF